MSPAWRYVVRPDASFCRMPNIDGCLDSMSDEQLEALASHALRPDKDKAPRPCSRCGEDLLLHWNGPIVTGVQWMELCADCDAERPAAGALIRWHHDPDRDPKALPQLFEDWESETMHAHGWSRVPQEAAPSGPLIPPGLTPRGRV